VKTATPAAVKATLQRLTTIGDGMLVKRKYKTAGDTSKRVIRWWFVVRDEEANLQRLQEEWPQISAQTAWKLEKRCGTRYVGEMSQSFRCRLMIIGLILKS